MGDSLKGAVMSLIRFCDKDSFDLEVHGTDLLNAVKDSGRAFLLPHLAEIIRLAHIGQQREAMSETAPHAPNDLCSKEAADKIKPMLRGLRSDVLSYIILRGPYGATGSEICDALNLLPNTAKPRCTELFAAGYLIKAGKRKNEHGNNEVVWVAL
jgi:hypothetical protein